MTNNTGRADRLLTIRELAELTGLAVGTLYHLVSQKRVPVVRISRRCIRFRLSSLESWFEELTEKAVTDIGKVLHNKSTNGEQ